MFRIIATVIERLQIESESHVTDVIKNSLLLNIHLLYSGSRESISVDFECCIITKTKEVSFSYFQNSYLAFEAVVWKFQTLPWLSKFTVV